MSVRIDQRSETSFLAAFNGSDEIFTTVTSSAADVEEWLHQMLRDNRHHLSRLIVGLDVEWRPNYGRYRNPIAVLQLCVGDACLVFQIIHADYVPRALFNFMMDGRFTFFGVGIDEDVEKMVGDYGLNVSNAVDLRGFAANKMGRRDLMGTGLAGLALEVMQVQVDKPRRVTMSRWDNIYLTFDQISYAAVDAFLSLEIGRMLLDGEF